MTSSPAKNGPHIPSPTSTIHQLSSPRSTRSLRKLQSAHQLSANYNALNAPSLISQQRQQQNRVPSSSQNPLVPPVPSIPAHHSPQKPAHSRTRSNTDVVMPSDLNPAPIARRTAPLKKQGSAAKKDELRALVTRGPRGDIDTSLQSLRKLIIDDGIETDNDGMSQLRIYVWLILLNAPTLPTDTYLSLIHRGPSPAYAKIRNDTFRTLATDPLFKRRVSEASLIRLLNAIAWKLHDAKNTLLPDGRPLTNSANELGSPELQHASPVIKHAHNASTTTNTEGSEAGGSSPGIYVQGMNVLCAPFLYAARSEAEAFVAFHRFITRECPGYVRGAMDGVHRGLQLVDKCLAILDPKLSAHLISKGMKAEVYAFASVLTMCACTPPLPEVLQLWDFLFAYGPHLNVLCICVQLLMMKEKLFASSSPGTLLRNFPHLKAKEIIQGTINSVRKIPNDLYEELVHHME